MSSAKLIQNPEVPGLECYLPPPPPPPLPPPPPPPLSPPPLSLNEPSDNNARLTTTRQHHPATTSDNLTADMTPVPTDEIPPALSAFPNMSPMPRNPYMMHPIQPQTPGQTPTPWWIPTDSDTTDFYTQWYDSTYKNVVPMPIAPSAVTSVSKSKNKSSYKRKSEFIDPTQDAEKVANAQRQLSALMKPLKCDLCNAVMNSPLQAKLHYEGKPHQKKVSMFLNQSVKKLKSEDGVSGTTNNDWQLYCDICKTWFTSQTDATQHYAGKKHIRAANGGPRVSRPSKKSLQNQYNQVDPTGRFGIGMAFQTDAQPTPAQSGVTPTVTSNGAASAPNPVYVAPPYPTPFRCDLCGVSATRQDQLETHKRGARHMRMLRLNGLPVPEAKAELSRQIDYSIYRTPSGQYYCAPCNLSVTSEITFAQHIESKKHRTHTNPKLPNTAVAPNKPESKKK